MVAEVPRIIIVNLHFICFKFALFGFYVIVYARWMFHFYSNKLLSNLNNNCFKAISLLTLLTYLPNKLFKTFDGISFSFFTSPLTKVNMPFTFVTSGFRLVTAS